MNMEPLPVKVSDLGLAAALVTCGYKIRVTRWDEKDRAYFIFDDDEELLRTVEKYWADTLELKVRKFYDNTKMLKGRIYADR